MGNKAIREFSDTEGSNLWTIVTKLEGMASLFRNIHAVDFNPKELYGISLLLEDLAKEIKTYGDESEN